MSQPRQQIVEIAFEGYVRQPDSRHNTNVIRLGTSNGPIVGVDTIDVGAYGVRVTKKVKGVLHASLYPWHVVRDVKYLPVIEDADEETVPFLPPTSPAA